MTNAISNMARFAATSLPRGPVVQSNRDAATIVHRFLKKSGALDHPQTRKIGRELLSRLGLDKMPDAKANPQTQSFVSLIQTLHQRQGAGGWDRLSLALEWTKLKPGTGARHALSILAAKPALWTRLNVSHRTQVARMLGRAGTTKAVGQVQAFVQKLLGNRYFQAASDKGKSNALTNPKRTLDLLKHPDLLPSSAGKARKDAATFIGNWMRTATPAARQKWLGDVVFNHAKFTARYFEDVPGERAVFKRSVWYGEALQQSFGTDWAQKIFNFLKTWHQTNACLTVHGAGSVCTDPYAGFTPAAK